MGEFQNQNLVLISDSELGGHIGMGHIAHAMVPRSSRRSSANDIRGRPARPSCHGQYAQPSPRRSSLGGAQVPESLRAVSIGLAKARSIVKANSLTPQVRLYFQLIYSDETDVL